MRSNQFTTVNSRVLKNKDMKRTRQVFSHLRHCHKGRIRGGHDKIIPIHETRKLTALDLKETEIAAINLKLGVKFPLITLQ